MRTIQLPQGRIEQEHHGWFFISNYGNKYGPYIGLFEAINRGTIDSQTDLDVWLPSHSPTIRTFNTRKDTQ